MKNFTVLTGRLPGFDGKWKPNEKGDDSKDMMGWAINVSQYNTKKKGAEYDEDVLVNITAYGYNARLLNRLMEVPKEERNKMNIQLCVSGKLSLGYLDKDENFIISPSISGADVEILSNEFRGKSKASKVDGFEGSDTEDEAPRKATTGGGLKKGLKMKNKLGSKKSKF